MIELKKIKQRSESSIKRKLITKNIDHNLLNLNQLIKQIEHFKKSKVIASFVSIHSEISTTNLNNFFKDLNKNICFPVIQNNCNYLIFREFTSNTIFRKGKFGILEPDINSKELLPDLVLTPCLAFDLNGYRLGYGGGFYDKTFARFKKIKHNFISIAVAFDEQKVEKVEHNQYDQKIDYVLTEKKVYRIK